MIMIHSIYCINQYNKLSNFITAKWTGNKRRRVERRRRSRKLHFFLTKFRQTATNFWQRRFWVLKILILPLNFTQMTVFGSKWPNIFRQEKFFLTAQNVVSRLPLPFLPLSPPSGSDATRNNSMFSNSMRI